MTNKLYCGASRKCITPPKELLPNLYGLMGQRFGGVLDDLFIRTLALKSGETTLLFVCFDLDKAPYPRKWIQALSQRLAVPEKNIAYCAIHTHCAPITDERPYEGPNRRYLKPPEQLEAVGHYENFLFQALIAAADEAVASLQPAKFGYACTDSYVNVNRNVDYAAEDGGLICGIGCNGAGDVDRTLFLAKFEGENGSPIAFFLNYAVHNCILHQNTICNGKLAISSDLGGNISQKLEEQNPGSVALWTSGAAGDVNPILMNEICYPSTDNGSCVTEQLAGDQTLFLRMMVSRHYADVTTALRKIECNQSSAKLAGQISWVKTPGRKFPEPGFILPEEDRGENPEYRIRLQGLRIGHLTICGVSGELYTSFARKIQAISPFAQTLILNHNACQMANSQYILDDDGIARAALGYNHSFIRPGFVGAALEKAVAELFEDLLRQSNETGSEGHHG